MNTWTFAIDVGGTFTDCVARKPDGTLVTTKLLSSGTTKGRITALPQARQIIDDGRKGDPDGFWIGCELRLLGERGETRARAQVVGFDWARGLLELDRVLDPPAAPGLGYELSSGEEAPIVAIRRLLGLRLSEPIPPCEVRLGTTRGTNALLTRRGARTAFVTTRGFGDLLHIGTQHRPRLFELTIRKPEPLFQQVVEIEERVSARGEVLRAPDRAQIERALVAAKEMGAESLGICLLHATAHPEHEQLVARLAREVGFEEVSVSSEVAPLEKIVARGDTTLMDAYLNPILRRYVASLKSALGGSRLQIMTSSGGLVDADRFVGKDSILSGPAGGVTGYAHAAATAGFDHAIGFDMGGTSTDVSRWDGRPELELETEKAGVRIAAPMLAIKTVAAGGGSLCAYDGVKLTVGPDSAGADPGPACYGLGGPLTLTDCNLVLGRLLPERFPFSLDRAAPERLLAALAARIAERDGKRYSPAELADGFLRVAHATMVRAIRAISVAKGYDPADYVLVCFGGAGAQHACAMARELRMRRVLCHPFAGVLSAHGIGLADVRRFQSASVLRPYSEAEVAALEPLLAKLAVCARAEVETEVVAERIEPPLRCLDLRYQGMDAVIPVEQPQAGTFARAYERLHEQLFGYSHAGRPLEIVAARVEVVGRSPAPPAARAEPAAAAMHRAAPKHAATTTMTCFEGVARQTAVHAREALLPGQIIEGPAIVCESTSTIVVDPGWRAVVTCRNEILLEDRGGPGPALSTEVDPVSLEIYNHHFAQIAEEMGIVLSRTASSTNVKERLDFSCALFTATGDLVVNAPHIPVHLGAMSETVRHIRADNPDLGPGDVYVTNDPYRGGSHLPDITVVTPVHDGAGTLLFFVASRAHHADVGGIVPGSMPPFSKNLGEEGVLIRNFKLVARGKSREAELRTLLGSGPHPARDVPSILADLSAQVAANQAGVRRLEERMARDGLPVVLAYMRHIQDAAARKMRLALGKLAPGRRHFTDHLDDGTPICVTLEVADEQATVDFEGTGAALPGNLNANRAITTAAVLYAFRCLIDEEIPLNAGVLEPITIRIPAGCLLDPPPAEDPSRAAAVVGGNVETSQRIVDVLLGALGLAAASQGTMNNLTFGDGRFGYYETICGGAGATADGPGACAVHTHMTNTRLTDVEVLERRYPVRVVRFGIRRGSGGAGLHRGGDGVVRELELLAPLHVSILSERRGPYPPYGLQGGAPGAFGRNLLLRAGGAREPEVLAAKVAFEAGVGDRLIVETPGGGGYGQEEWKNREQGTGNWELGMGAGTKSSNLRGGEH